MGTDPGPMGMSHGLWHVLCPDMLRKMVTIQRVTGESDADFMTRFNSKIKHLKCHHGVQDWDKRYYTLMFRWAGHVCRMTQYNKERLTHKVLQHRNWEAIQRIAQANSGNQLHGRKLKVWRWEAPLYKFFKEEPWQKAAQDKTSWNSQLEGMICWRCRAE